MSTEMSTDATSAAATTPTGAMPHALRRVAWQDWALFPVVIVLLVVGATISDRFLTSANLLTVLTQASVVGVVSVGMTFVITTGGIDLSVGSMLAAASVAGGVLAGVETLSGVEGLAFLLGAILFGALLGTVNASVIVFARVVPFIATLAMFTVARGLALWMSGKTPISTASMDVVRWFGNGSVVGIPVPVLVFLAVTAGGWMLLNRTRYGRYVIAVGGNAEAARISGIPVQRIIFSVYVIAGLCVGIAAILLSGRLASASPVAGTLLELDAIAAVVIGGTSLAGGRSSMTGTFLGVLVFALIFNLLNLLNLPVEIQQIVKGAIIVAALAVQRRKR